MTVLYPAPYGALTPLFAGTMPEALNYNGEVRPFRCIHGLSPSLGSPFSIRSP